jgi:D-serine dehydratase
MDLADPEGRAAELLLDDRIRGIPPGTSGLRLDDIGERDWHPAEGLMSLPVMTLDEAAFAQNRALMLQYAREQGVAIAPHGKTPMIPRLARSLVDAGAWGTTVADIRQAAVMLRTGLTRLILANEVGGSGGARRLAALLAARPEAEIYVFVDSVAAVRAYAEVWRRDAALAPLRVLVEVGTGRAGARDQAGALDVIDAVQQEGDGRLVLAGVGTYEGTAATADAAKTREAIDALLALASKVFQSVRKRVGREAKLILTAGGSGFFDVVVATLRPLVEADGNSLLVLRSGAIFFYDHGVYQRTLSALDERQGFRLGGKIVSAADAFRPALRIWAEVLSCPEPGLALCGMGMRDVAFDQGYPRPLRLYREGSLLGDASAMEVTRLNDQHGYLAFDPSSDIRVGDVVELGISHPCTCLDRYHVVFGVNEAGRVRHAYPTVFG